jgi:hypothetical protein
MVADEKRVESGLFGKLTSPNHTLTRVGITGVGEGLQAKTGPAL